MAASLLFSEDILFAFADMPITQRQPPHLQLATPKTTTVEHWLSQQSLQSSTVQQPAFDMSSFNGSYGHPNQVPDDFIHENYTFTTEHHEGDYTQWSNAQQSLNPGLQLETHPVSHLPSTSSVWGYTFNTTTGDDVSSPAGYLLSPNYSPESNLSPFSISRAPLPQASPVASELSLSPAFSMSPGLPSPSTPESSYQAFMPSPTPSEMGTMLLLDNQSHPKPDRLLYTHREQLGFFRDALSLPMDNVGPFLPQQMYKPHTTSDRKRYVEEVSLEAPLYFVSERSQQYGIRLEDALHLRTRKLRDRDQVVFEGRGPSVSIRLEWPGYRQWSRQIPTKDFRSPPQPITLAKLAKNVAKCVQRFLNERKSLPMEEEFDPRWKIGDGPQDIKLEDLILVSLHHVSLGSWQPQLRLVRPLPQRQMTMPPTPLTATNTVPHMSFRPL